MCISFPIFAAETDGKWDKIDRVVAVVNNTPIVESDFNRRLSMIMKGKNRAVATPSRVLDLFINEIVLDQAAVFQAIQISDEKIDNDIKNIMQRFGVTDKEVFRKQVEQEQGISFEEFRREVRKQAITEQLMMIAVNFNPPSIKEEKEWYEANKSQLVQVRMKQILIKPKGNGFAAEKAANERMKDIQRKLLAGQSFDDVARKDSEDAATAGKGGDMGWVMLAETDPYLANQVMQSYSQGGVSGIIKSSFGYHILKFYDKRQAPFAEVEDRINNMLGNKKRGESFEKWVMDARRESEVKIYLEGYKPPQG
jgi:putative peptidyl-prolyl cis-trans isomerase